MAAYLTGPLSTWAGLLLPFLATSAAVCYLSYRWKRRHFYALSRELPGPPGLPVLGNALDFLVSPEGFVEKCTEYCNQYKSPFRVWIGHQMVVVIYRPEDIQIVLNSPKALQKHPFYRFFKNSMGNGLFAAPVEKWKKHRRAISPAFNTKLLELAIPVFNEQNRALVDSLADHAGQPQFDVYHLIEATDLNIICHTALGFSLKEDDKSKDDFIYGIKRTSELNYMRIYTYWQQSDFIYTLLGKEKEVEEAQKKLDVLPYSVINEKKKEFEKEKQRNELENGNIIGDSRAEKSKNFLEILLELSESGTNFTDKDLRDEIVTILVGGYETSAVTNSLVLLMLAMHPAIQQKVFEEVESVLGDSDGDITAEHLARLVYMEQVIKETLRRFPIGPLISRQLTDSLQLTTCTLPADCPVVLVPLAVHMQGDLFPKPEEFDPERFSSGNAATRPKGSYIPFSSGPRGCIGMKYGMLSMKTTIAAIIRRFRLSTSWKMADIKLSVALVIRSVNGYPIKIEERTEAPRRKGHVPY